MRSRNRIPGEIVEGRGRVKRSFSFSKALGAIYVAIIGILVGWQIFNPSKRFIEAVAGLIFIGIIWNFSAIQALWLLMLTYPFPFAFSMGSSTIFFILVVFIIYMVHVSTGRYRFHGDKLLNLPIALIVITYIISFYNQSSEPRLMAFAIYHTTNFFGVLILYYMLINLINDEKTLRRTVSFFLGSTALITFFSFLELLFPGRVLLPNLIYSTHKIRLVMKDVRVGGPFHDYEALAEFYAMNVPIILFMIQRSRRLLLKTMYTVLLISVLFMQFATMTRGAFISLMIGIIYMAWICRRDISIVRLTGLVAAFATGLVVINATITRYTTSGSLFKRLLGTTVERGYIPDTRVGAWTGAVTRWLLHPYIGNGPGWDFMYDIGRKYWPHNSYLYYLNITGIFGLIPFLMLLYRLVRASHREVHQPLWSAPFPRALMKMLHVTLVIFIIDIGKTDFQRNDIYMCYVWIFFALISATRTIIDKSVEPPRLSGSTD